MQIDRIAPSVDPSKLYESLIAHMTPERQQCLYRICNEVILENHDFFLAMPDEDLTSQIPILRLVRDEGAA
ncbi:MAG: hypothetical protein FWD61_09390 [Phycisphaerales bacterium]|nr:hypothetical protein [Phycisphaerales bacterium]